MAKVNHCIPPIDETENVWSYKFTVSVPSWRLQVHFKFFQSHSDLKFNNLLKFQFPISFIN